MRLILTGELNADVQPLIGLPYQPDGDTPSGFDCFGLVRWLYAQRGIVLPTEVRHFRRQFIDATAPYEPWDVALFMEPSTQVRHCAVITAYPYAIQASIATNGVSRISLHRDPWQSWLVGIYHHDPHN